MRSKLGSLPRSADPTPLRPAAPRAAQASAAAAAAHAMAQERDAYKMAAQEASQRAQVGRAKCSTRARAPPPRGPRARGGPPAAPRRRARGSACS